jgi:hypothetical protein
LPGPVHARAMREFDQINGEFHSGRRLGSRKLKHLLGGTEQILSTLETLPREPQRLEDTALAHQLRAELYFALGDNDAGIDAAFSAGELFKQAGGKSENFGRFLHDFAVQLNQLTASELALKYARLAAKVLAPYGEHYRRDLAAFVSRLEEGTNQVGASRLTQLRADFKAARHGHRAAAAGSLAIGLIQSDQPAEHLAEIHDLLEVAFRESLAAGRQGLERPASAVVQMIELYWHALPLPEWTPTALQQLLAAIKAAGREDLEAEVLTVQAVWLLSRDQRSEALSVAAGAIALHDRVAVRSDTSLVRALTGRINQYARLFALTIACGEGKAAQAAELVECARLQVEPVTYQIAERAHAPTSRVGRLRHVSVNGHSWLGGSGVPDPIALEDCITAVGGPGAAWWGTWMAYERIFWALSLQGKWSCGMLSLSEGTQLRQLLHAAWEQSPMTPSTPSQAILKGPWCSTVTDEAALSTALGHSLIPPALQAALADALFDNHPISLVVAGNLVAMLPIPSLGFATPDRRFARLIEAAVLRVAPPAVLLDRIRTAAGAAELNPLHLACVDPRDNLHFSSKPPGGARRVLGGDPERRDGPAPLKNLQHELSWLTPGQPGLFYYSGHAEGGGGDDQDALALAGDDALTAHNLLSDASAPPMPARVMLSACSSAGATGAGAGEWLGLTAGAIWRGARQVLATNWPIWDTPFTARFDHDLARRLQRAADPAAALRQAQLDALSDWQNSEHDLSEFDEDGLPYSLGQLAFPLIWAAYSCVGVQR